MHSTNFEKVIPAKNLKVQFSNPWILFALIVAVYISMNFMTLAGQTYILQNLTSRGWQVSWKTYMILSIIILILLYVLTRWLHISFLTIETSEL
jgi:phosphatidylglycerophosphate synthase